MRTTDFQITTRDRMVLAATLYQGDAASGSQVALIAPATGARRTRYARFASFLAAQGWSVVTFDYRGIGGSRQQPEGTPAPTMQAWGELDLADVITWIHEHHRPSRLVAVTHSIGGQLLALAPNHHLVDAMVAVGVQKGYWRLWPGPRKYGVYLFFKLYIPLCVALFGRLPLRMAALDDLPPGVALDWARWCQYDDFLDAGRQSLRERFSRFRAPILALSFEDDIYFAPREAVDSLMERYYVNAPCLRCHIIPAAHGLEEVGHSGFFDREDFPQRWWLEVSNWLKSGTLEPPSMAEGDSLLARGTPLRKAPVSPGGVAITSVASG